jgi:CRP-like cAMP-binding protein
MISRLSGATKARWGHLLSPLDLPVGAVLQSAGTPIHNVYFPLNAVVAQCHEVDAGTSMATLLIGSEGLVGCSGVLSPALARHESVVVKPGRVMRVPVSHLRSEMERDPTICRWVLAYVQSQVELLAQAALCSRFHQVEQQLCLRLSQLFADDEAAELPLTQETLARIVGARRERVNQVVGELQGAGVLESGRGRIRLLDGKGLTARACSCQQVWRRERLWAFEPNGTPHPESLDSTPALPDRVS